MFHLLCLILIAQPYQTLPRMVRRVSHHCSSPLVFSSRMVSLSPPPLPKLPLMIKTPPPLQKKTFNSILKTLPRPLVHKKPDLQPRVLPPLVVSPLSLPRFSTGPLCGKYVALDTESTGLRGKKEREPNEIDQLTEIGCVEIVDGKITGKYFRRYINPEQRVTPGAHRITGHTWYFLQQFPTFGRIAPDFLRFIKGAKLVIHDAPGDLKLINTALKHYGNPYGNLEDKHEIIDTLSLARHLDPGQKVNLTALCKKHLKGEFDEKRDRSKHGALIDARLLARVFCAITPKNDGIPVDNPQTSPQETDRNLMKEEMFPNEEDDVDVDE